MFALDPSVAMKEFGVGEQGNPGGSGGGVAAVGRVLDRAAVARSRGVPFVREGSPRRAGLTVSRPWACPLRVGVWVCRGPGPGTPGVQCPSQVSTQRAQMILKAAIVSVALSSHGGVSGWTVAMTGSP